MSQPTHGLPSIVQVWNWIFNLSRGGNHFWKRFIYLFIYIQHMHSCHASNLSFKESHLNIRLTGSNIGITILQPCIYILILQGLIITFRCPLALKNNMWSLSLYVRLLFVIVWPCDIRLCKGRMQNFKKKKGSAKI